MEDGHSAGLPSAYKIKSQILNVPISLSRFRYPLSLQDVTLKIRLSVFTSTFHMQSLLLLLKLAVERVGFLLN